MKLLLTALKHTRKPAVYICHRFCSSACSISRGPSSLQDEVIVGSSPELVQTVGSQVEVRPGFITEEEEAALLQELEPGLRKKRYEFDHWDDAIHGYRETERLRWAPVCEEILSRVRSVAFPQGGPLLGPMHVLDLDKAGYIKPHVDSVKFCGSTIAGLSLLSDSIMRLVKENAPNEWLDLLLTRRSLYILRDQARYNFTHEILKDEDSVFNGQRVPRHAGYPLSIVTFQANTVSLFLFKHNID